MKAKICNHCGTVLKEANPDPTKAPYFCPLCKEELFDIDVTEIDTEDRIPGKSYQSRTHMCVVIEGMLRYYGRRKMKGVMKDDNGREMSDKECRDYLKECQAKGWKLIPMCKDSECPDFDHFEHGCPGHLLRVTDSTEE